MTDQHDHADHPHHLKEELQKHLHEIPQKLKEIPHNLEQQPPNKPSFLTVVILSGVVLIILFIVALLILHFGGARMRHSFRKYPTSQVMPLPPTTSPATLV